MQETPTCVYVEDLLDSGAAATGCWSVLSEGTDWVSHVPLTTCSRRRTSRLQGAAEILLFLISCRARANDTAKTSHEPTLDDETVEDAVIEAHAFRGKNFRRARRVRRAFAGEKLGGHPPKNWSLMLEVDV